MTIRRFTATAAAAAAAILLSLSLTGSASAAVQFDLASDDFAGTSISVEIDGIDELNTEITDVSGIVSNTVLVNGTPRTSYEPIVITRVYKGADAVYQWRQAVEVGQIERRNIVVTVYDATFVPVRQIFLSGAWPSRWEMPSMTSGSTGPQTEQMTFHVEAAIELAL